MEKHVLLLAITASTFSLGCFAQQNNKFLVNTKVENLQLLSNRMSKNEFVIVSYQVEEKINLKFGGTTTTYTVPTLDMVNTNDLGEENSRTVTPKYVRAKVVGLNAILPKETFVFAPDNKICSDLNIPPYKKTYVRINLFRTYERVLEKGFCTVEMLKKVGDWRYFEGDLEASEKWYTELLCLTTDLEAEFFYRYAMSLKFVGQTDKAKEIMAIYESKKQ